MDVNEYKDIKDVNVRFNQLSDSRLDKTQFGTIVRDPNNPRF